MRFRAAAGTLLLLALAGCAARSPHTWRLVRQDGAPVPAQLAPPSAGGDVTLLLVPPRVAPTVQQRTLDLPVAASAIGCVAPAGSGIAVERRGRRLRITLARETLRQRAAGWLRHWAESLEAAGCLAPGEAWPFAATLASAVPLHPAVAARLLQPNDIRAGYVDLGPGNRLQVVSPVFQPGASPELETTSVSGSGTRLEVEVRAPGLLGVETAWYGLRATPSGLAVTPLAAERSWSGRVEPIAAAQTNYFEPLRPAACYRLLYKSSPGDHLVTAILVSATGAAELDRRTRAAATIEHCDAGSSSWCAEIPRRSAVNPFLVATVNGRQTALALNATVGTAIQHAGVKESASVISSLSLTRPYHGVAVPVTFDRSDSGILQLPLHGGETLSWK